MTPAFRQRVQRFALITAIVSCSPMLSAQHVDSAFVRAGERYRAGAFGEAAQLYESIIKEGFVSGEVYFNLGNAYYREGNVGCSILSYERAARRLPADRDVAHNLRLARLKAVDRIEPLPEFFLVAWLRVMSDSVSPILVRDTFLVCWMLAFMALAAFYLGRTEAIVRWSRIVFFVAVPMALVLGGLWLAQVMALSDDHAGIILTPTVTARSSPDANAVDAFVIHEGLKVEIGMTVDGWTRVTLADGKVGWILEGSVERI